MTVSLAKELANSGITVNTVTPGPIMTAGWVDWARGIASARGWGDDLAQIEHRVVQEILPTRWDGSDASMTLPTRWHSS